MESDGHTMHVLPGHMWEISRNQPSITQSQLGRHTRIGHWDRVQRELKPRSRGLGGGFERARVQVMLKQCSWLQLPRVSSDKSDQAQALLGVNEVIGISK